MTVCDVDCTPLTIRRGDDSPDLWLAVDDGDDLADLSTATAIQIRFRHAARPIAEEILLPGTYDAVSEAGYNVRHIWLAGETEAMRVGHWGIEVIVTWPGDKQQTFPRDAPLHTWVRD